METDALNEVNEQVSQGCLTRTWPLVIVWRSTRVATKNRIIVHFYGVLNSICYLGYFLVLWKPKLLFCVVDIDQFSSLHHQETTIMQCTIAVCLYEFDR